MIRKTHIFALMTARDQIALDLRTAHAIEQRYQTTDSLSQALVAQHRALRAEIREALRASGLTMLQREALYAEHTERAERTERAAKRCAYDVNGHCVAMQHNARFSCDGSCQ